MITFNNDPNFSIVMPGGCNANCQFCFNKDKKNVQSDISNFDWIIGLYETLKSLPEQFYQISITGNEPMISPMLDEVMSLCRKVKDKYTNILLTTNGTNLLDKIETVAPSVHHINISRHHYSQSENMSIFGGQYNVTDNELCEIIDRYSAVGVDVSLNCVIDDTTTSKFIYEYVRFAKLCGVHAVRFRKQNGDNLDMTPCEREIDAKYPILSKGECPVCRTWGRVIMGLNTYFKAAVIEPTDRIRDAVYEIVYDVDGGAYLDWNRSIKVDDFLEKSKERRMEQEKQVRAARYWGRNCGVSDRHC